MTGNAALTEEMTRLLDEHPREALEKPLQRKPVRRNGRDAAFA